MAENEKSGITGLYHAGLYSIYVLIILLIAYLLNQLDRYTLPIVTSQMAQDLHYGDQVCMVNSTAGTNSSFVSLCKNVSTENRCASLTDENGTHICKWDYNGQGLQYQIIAGPVFILIYTFAAIPLGFAADLTNRKNLLAVSVFFFSLMTLLMGFTTEYWQLVLLRFGLGFGEAGCTPFASSLLTDYFPPVLRASALGVYNWGIYMGYSLAYALGNLITDADIMGQGWRWFYYIAGMPGLLLGVLIFFSIREPERVQTGVSTTQGILTDQGQLCSKLGHMFKQFLRPSPALLCLAGSIRNAAGYVWAYNTQPYYESIGQSSIDIAKYMSWIPLVGGSIGVVLGGFISDRIVKNQPAYKRIWVLVVSQLISAPFAAGAIFLPPPWCYLSLIPGYIFGEMWVGVTMAVLVELVAASVRTSAVALYMFIISNVGGNMPLLVPPLQTAFKNAGYDTTDSLRGALCVLYPGLYVLSSALFLTTLCVLQRDIRSATEHDYAALETRESSSSSCVSEELTADIEDKNS